MLNIKVTPEIEAQVKKAVKERGIKTKPTNKQIGESFGISARSVGLILAGKVTEYREKSLEAYHEKRDEDCNEDGLRKAFTDFATNEDGVPVHPYKLDDYGDPMELSFNPHEVFESTEQKETRDWIRRYNKLGLATKPLPTFKGEPKAPAWPPAPRGIKNIDTRAPHADSNYCIKRFTRFPHLLPQELTRKELETCVRQQFIAGYDLQPGTFRRVEEWATKQGDD